MSSEWKLRIPDKAGPLKVSHWPFWVSLLWKHTWRIEQLYQLICNIYKRKALTDERKYALLLRKSPILFLVPANPCLSSVLMIFSLRNECCFCCYCFFLLFISHINSWRDQCLSTIPSHPEKVSETFLSLTLPNVDQVTKFHFPITGINHCRKLHGSSKDRCVEIAHLLKGQSSVNSRNSGWSIELNGEPGSLGTRPLKEALLWQAQLPALSASWVCSLLPARRLAVHLLTLCHSIVLWEAISDTSPSSAQAWRHMS